MKICGIVAEYNPIHNGHVYHIRKAKELTGCDCVVVCMSGDFTQRGEPAIADKYTRTKMALMQGADAVVELPTVYATASADFFALGAVSILDRLGCDYICFGSECGEMDVLNRELDIQTELENKYLSEIKEEIKNGKSYIKALGSVAKNHGYSSTELKSNDRLALCYLKAMHACNSSMIPVCVKRLHGEYLDKDVAFKSLSKENSLAISLMKSTYAFATSRLYLTLKFESVKSSYVMKISTLPRSTYSLSTVLIELSNIESFLGIFILTSRYL